MSRLYMWPRHATDDITHGALADAKRAGEFILRCYLVAIEFSHLQDRFRLQFRQAMRLSEEPRRAALLLAVLRIISFGSEKQMRWITAGRIVTTVKDAERLVCRWVRQEICQAMCAPLATFKFDRTIAISKQRPMPLPTCGRIRTIGIRPEALFGVRCDTKIGAHLEIIA